MSSIQSDSQITLCKNYEALTEEAVTRIIAICQNAIEERGSFNILLSGGFAARGVYSLMANAKHRSEFDWSRIHFFWGDEKWVRADDKKSHYRVVAEVLLTRVDLPIENIHPIITQADSITEAAHNYDENLSAFFHLKEGEVPRFDLVLLGLGYDGHVASLFPGHDALSETQRLTAAVTMDHLDAPRITVTYPVINAAENILFLVTGREKSEILKKVLEEELLGEEALPAQRIWPTDGTVSWIVDAQAASLIQHHT